MLLADGHSQAVVKPRVQRQQDAAVPVRHEGIRIGLTLGYRKIHDGPESASHQVRERPNRTVETRIALTGHHALNSLDANLGQGQATKESQF